MLNLIYALKDHIRKYNSIRENYNDTNKQQIRFAMLFIILLSLLICIHIFLILFSLFYLWTNIDRLRWPSWIPVLLTLCILFSPFPIFFPILVIIIVKNTIR